MFMHILNLSYEGAFLSHDITDSVSLYGFSAEERRRNLFSDTLNSAYIKNIAAIAPFFIFLYVCVYK
jgi:hypothetical protein